MKCGYGEYVRLMDHFATVVDVFLGLDEQFQQVIADITRRMGEGMAEFIQKEVRQLCMCRSKTASSICTCLGQHSWPSWWYALLACQSTYPFAGCTVHVSLAPVQSG